VYRFRIFILRLSTGSAISAYFSNKQIETSKNVMCLRYPVSAARLTAACDCGARLWQLDHKSNTSTWQSELPAKWRSAQACRLVKPKYNSVAQRFRERV
ncbi:hypothetical protein LEMLEM_LOCUS27627, partial [Lemmus lemmus]